MGDQNQCCTLCAIEFQHQFDDLTAGSGIEVAGGLVGKEYPGLGDEGAGERHALLFAAGEVFGQVVGTGAQADLLQRGLGTLARLFDTGQLQGKHYIFQCIQRGQQLKGLKHEARQFAAQTGTSVFIQLEQVGTMQQHAATARYVQPGQQSQQSGFTGTGGTHDGKTLARFHFKADIMQNNKRLIAT